MVYFICFPILDNLVSNSSSLESRSASFFFIASLSTSSFQLINMSGLALNSFINFSFIDRLIWAFSSLRFLSHSSISSHNNWRFSATKMRYSSLPFCGLQNLSCGRVYWLLFNALLTHVTIYLFNRSMFLWHMFFKCGILIWNSCYFTWIINY